MSRSQSQALGFTLMEIMVSSLLMSIVLLVVISSWLYLLHSQKLNAVQNELDIDVRTAMEWLRHDLRLTSMDEVFFYPDGPGPYVAISFPMARDDDGDGVIERDANGHIIWDRTIIYHRWNAVPNQLRITTFDPRDNNLTDQQRQEQLESVVSHGNGDYTYNSANATTMALFENLFDWAIYAKSAVFDAYSPVVTRAKDVVLGSTLLDNGEHEYTFVVVGKNDASSGYWIGIDTLVVSPCGAPREAEDQLPPTAQSGSPAEAEYKAGGSWSGNYQLFFPATAEGQYFTLTMENDRWEETNFRATGAHCEDTKVEFDTALSPKDFVVRLEGGAADTNWFAGEQTRDLDLETSGQDEVRGCAIRVLIRGEKMVDGGWIDHDGGNVRIRFDAGNRPLKIDAAYIAECADSTNPTPNAASPGVQLFFGSSPSVNISTWGHAWGQPAAGTAFPIEKEKSYLVSLLVNNNADSGTAELWHEASTNVPGCYVVPATNNPTEATVAQADWSAVPYVVTNVLYAVKHMVTTYATNGFFTSQIFDTHLDDPQYTEIDWSADVPAGTELSLKLRTGDDPALADAPAWSNVTALSGPGPITLPPGRYVQFQAQLKSNNDPDFSNCRTPKLKDVTLRWQGEQRITDIGGSFTTGPGYGIFKLLVDGNELKKGVRVELTIFEDVAGFAGKTKRLTSSMVAEVEPRNTGK